MIKRIRKIRREHGLNFFISYLLKKRLQALAQKYDTSLAEIVRTLLKIGIPVLEGYKQAQEDAEKELAKLISNKIPESKDPELTSPPSSPTGGGLKYSLPLEGRTRVGGRIVKFKGKEYEKNQISKLGL